MNDPSQSSFVEYTVCEKKETETELLKLRLYLQQDITAR